MAHGQDEDPEVLRLHGHQQVLRRRAGPGGGLVRPAPGEVHALVGENGAGKSTLIKVITGAHVPDEGTIEVNGRVVEDLDPVGARALGIAAIYQQPALFPDLTVAENIAIGLEPGGWWRRVRWDDRRDRACAAAGSHRRGDRPRGRRPRAVDARAAARGDRPGAGGRGADPDHGRADRLAERPGGRASVPRDRRVEGPRRGHHLHLAPAGGAAADRRPGDRVARRAPWSGRGGWPRSPAPS